MSPFNKADLEPHLSSVFEVLPSGQEPIPIRLLAVHEHASDRVEGFSLMFTGSPERVFPHDTYLLRHPVLGEHPIFLGPIHMRGGDANVIHYQAVFSMLKP